MKKSERIEKTREVLKQFLLKIMQIDDPNITEFSSGYTDNLIDEFSIEIVDKLKKK